MNKINSFKKYTDYLSGYKSSISIVMLVSIASAATTVPIPKIYAYLVDGVIKNNQVDKLIWAVSGLLLLLGGNALFNFMQSIFSISVKQKFRTQMRSDIYRKVQKLPYETLSGFVPSDLISRMVRDIDYLDKLLPNGIAQLLKDIVVIVGITIVMIGMDWQLTLLSGVMIPFFFLLFFNMMKSLEVKAKKSHDVQGVLQATLQEKIEGNRDIQLTNSYDYQSKNATKIISERESVLTQLNIHQAKIALVFGLFPLIGCGILWGIGGYWSIQGRLSIGEIIAFSYAFNYLFLPISNLFTSLSQIVVEIAALDRVFEVFSGFSSEIPEIPQEKITVPIQGNIECRHLCFGYQAHLPILENLSLHVSAGKIIGIIGENGSGKSTLFSLLLNLYQPQAGTLLIDGHRPQDYSENTLRRYIGLVPQNIFLFHATIKDNIIMGRQVSETQLEKACRLSGITDWVQQMDKGLHSVIREKGQNLSGGEKQKIAIARALVDDPSVLLLDEPSNHLDEAVKTSVQQGILLAKEGKTIIVTTHDITLLEGVDVIYELKNKKLIKREISYV